MAIPIVGRASTTVHSVFHSHNRVHELHVVLGYRPQSGDMLIVDCCLVA